jgi:hypothetical protein
LSFQEKPPTSSASDISGDESDEVKVEKYKEPPSRQKGKQPTTSNVIKKPSQRTVATWRRDDDDMEPSAKMLALVEQLRIAEDAGDKTIVYSQCAPPLFFSEGNYSHSALDRDIDAGLIGDAVDEVRNPELAVRREDEERDARCYTYRVPEGG